MMLKCKIETHASWDSFFKSPNIKKYLTEIEKKIGSDFTPKVTEDIFAVFRMDLAACKVVILGQDPYPKIGVATGRAFELKETKWSSTRINRSLLNILKLLHRNQTDPSSRLVASKSDVIKDIERKNFIIKPPDKLFKYWEEQGVLLLNTALTCEVGKPNSHSTYWEDFTTELLKFIDMKSSGITWFFWGNPAKKFSKLITNAENAKLFSHHPSRANNNVSNNFYKNNNFKDVNGINWCEENFNMQNV